MQQIRYTQKELEAILEPLSIEGKTESTITSVAALDKAQKGDLAFLSNLKYKDLVPSSRASIILIAQDYEGKPSEDQVYFRVENPSHALAKLCMTIEGKLWPKPIPGIHPTAVIEPTAEVDPEAHIGPLCVIGAGAKIKKNVALGAGVFIGVGVSIDEGSILMPQVRVLDYCQIGKRVRLHSGVVIGSDGFGYYFDGVGHRKIPQVGGVVIEDDVEIGANTTIDRARFSQTRIGAGTKIDNLVQIGHNVEIGKHCIIVAQTGIAGSSVLEDYVVVGGQVGIADHVRIGQGTKIGSQSGINHNLEAGSNVRGSPAYSYMSAQRVEILKKRLPELFARVSSLEKTIELLQNTDCKINA
ncbi:MAG: UDP-3-O-(3-hydroxymyristoyl)glucosamine N-acyltransferase [Verrucomicrobia bacterium]|nr:MAG: UDP-3-O-(3-hydroxymyristoyl)glucosamine N-acyltransferase [Verrucomicrobiota bacterium]